MSKQQNEKKVFQWIVSAFLSLFFLGILLEIFMLAAPFNENMLKRGITGSGLIQVSVDTFREEWSQMLKESALPADFAEELADSTILYATFAEGMENREISQGDTNRFQQVLEGKIAEYLESQGIAENEAAQKSAAQFVKGATASYSNYIFPVFIRKFYSVKAQIEKTMILFLGGSILCSIFSSICLAKGSHYCHQGIRLISISLVTAVAFYGVIVMYLYNKIKGWMVAVQPSFYQELIKEYEKYFGQTAVVIIIVGSTSFLLLQLLSRQMKMKGK